MNTGLGLFVGTPNGSLRCGGPVGFSEHKRRTRTLCRGTGVGITRTVVQPVRWYTYVHGAGVFVGPLRWRSLQREGDGVWRVGSGDSVSVCSGYTCRRLLCCTSDAMTQLDLDFGRAGRCDCGTLGRHDPSEKDVLDEVI